MKCARKYGNRYPWDKWFSNETFTLHQGKDYKHRTYTMAQMCRNVAHKYGVNKLSITISDNNDSLTVTVYGSENCKIRNSSINTVSIPKPNTLHNTGAGYCPLIWDNHS